MPSCGRANLARAQVTFEAFSCFEFDGGAERTAYLAADVSIQCWAGDETTAEYASLRQVAFIAMAIYPIGLVLLNGALLFAARKAILLERATLLSGAIKFLYREYKREFFWWELAEMLRRVVLVGIMVLLLRGTITQLVIGTVFTLTYLLLQMQARHHAACHRRHLRKAVCHWAHCSLRHVAWQANPYKDLGDNYLAGACSFSLCIVFVCSIMFKIATLTELREVLSIISSEQQSDFNVPTAELSIVLLASVIGAVVPCSMIILVVQLARERAQMEKEARLRRLPLCDWRLAKNQGYGARRPSHDRTHPRPPRQPAASPTRASRTAGCTACFLSHYKEEAGADARYLKDSLDMMLGCAVYLDSSNLADLRSLFYGGVHASEVFVLLLSEGTPAARPTAHLSGSVLDRSRARIAVGRRAHAAVVPARGARGGTDGQANCTARAQGQTILV